MTNERIERQNRRLADLFGRTPVHLGSQPIFAWKWAPDLMVPIRIERGGLMLIGSYEMVRQVPEADERWLVGQWLPSGSQRNWEAKYGREIPWPQFGMYVSNNKLWARIGQEPDDECTEFAFLLIREHIDGTTARQLEKEKFQKELAIKAMWSDAIDDAWVESVPGKRGGPVSYPVTSAEPEKRIVIP